MALLNVTTADTLQEVFVAWVSDSINDIYDRARINVSGRLLKARSGKLRDSLFRKFPSLSTPNYQGEVGTGLDYGIIWELYGVRGPFGTKSGRGNLKLRIPFDGSMRGIAFAGKGGKGSKFQSSIIFRKSSYSRVRYKAPVEYLKKALMTEMTGSRGNRKLAALATGVGISTLNRFNRMWSGNYGANITVSIVNS